MRLQSDEKRRVQYQIYGLNEAGVYEPFKYLGRYPYIKEDHLQTAIHDAGMVYRTFEIYRIITERFM